MIEVDKELLELAAKAAGHEIDQRVSPMTWRDCRRLALLNQQGGNTLWNPLEDDGDALRLAVKRKVFFNPLFVHCLAVERLANQDADDTKAYRRAIVGTAAAEIGMGAVEIGRAM